MAAAQGCGADGLAELRIADTRAFQGVVVRRSGVVALVIRADYAPEHVASAKGQCQRYSAEQDANADSHVTTITAVGKCQLPISSPGSRRLRLICGSLERALEERHRHEHEPPRSPYFNTCVLVLA